MKQHAFLVLAHKQPLLLQRILKHLSNDNHYFFVHIDAKNTHFEEFKEALKNIPHLALLSNKYKVYHAGISIVDTNYRPFDFTEEDYNYIINSKAFFCRKVDEVKSATLLNMIDAQRGDNYNIEEHKHYV